MKNFPSPSYSFFLIGLTVLIQTAFASLPTQDLYFQETEDCVIRLYGNYNITPQVGSDDIIITTYDKKAFALRFLVSCCNDDDRTVAVEDPKMQVITPKEEEKGLYAFNAKLYDMENSYTIRIKCGKKTIGTKRIVVKVDQNSMKRDDVAIIFAVGKHSKAAKEAGWEDLKYSVEDAKALKWTLEKKFGFKVKLFVDPTWEEIDEAMVQVRNRKWNPLDQLFVYFTGHGHMANGKGYFIPSNAGSSVKTYFKMEDLRSYIDETPCNNIVLGIDACFASSFLERGGKNVSYTSSSNDIQSLLSSDAPFRYFIGSSPSNREVKEKGIYVKEMYKAKGKYKYSKKKFKISEFMMSVLDAIEEGEKELKGRPIPIWYVGRKVEELYKPKKKITGQYSYARATRFGSQQDKGFHFLISNSK